MPAKISLHFLFVILSQGMKLKSFTGVSVPESMSIVHIRLYFDNIPFGAVTNSLCLYSNAQCFMKVYLTNEAPYKDAQIDNMLLS